MSRPARKILIFMGSTRKGRNCTRVAKFMERQLTDRGYVVDIFDPVEMKFPLLQQPIHFYQDKSEIPNWLSDADARVKAADAFVVISGEYNHSIPPALTNTMDHFPPRDYAMKPSLIVTYSVSPKGGYMSVAPLRTFLSVLTCSSVPVTLNIPHVTQALSETGEVQAEDGRLEVVTKKGLDQLKWMMEAVRERKERVSLPDI